MKLASTTALAIFGAALAGCGDRAASSLGPPTGESGRPIRSPCDASQILLARLSKIEVTANDRVDPSSSSQTIEYLYQCGN